MPAKKIRQAVKVLGNKDRNPRHFRHRLELPPHPEFPGRLFKLRPERAQVEGVQRPFHAHEKQPGFMVLMLIGVRDVRAIAVKEACHSRHQTLTVGTVDKENGCISHVSATGTSEAPAAPFATMEKWQPN